MMCFEMSTVLYMMITWQSAFVINVELRISNVETLKDCPSEGERAIGLSWLHTILSRDALVYIFVK